MNDVAPMALNQKEITFKIDSETAGERLDLFLSRQLTDYSRSQIEKAITQAMVSVSGEIRKKKYTLHAGDIVRIGSGIHRVQPPTHVKPAEGQLDIVYEDEEIVIINKAAGSVVHPGAGNYTDTLAAHVLHYLGTSAGTFSDTIRPGVVHRLDKQTSGVLIFAKNDQMQSKIADLFQHRKIQKWYIGVYQGAAFAAQETVERPIGRSKTNPVARAVSPGGKPAHTDIYNLWWRQSIGAALFHLHTGRTHQIRVHAASLNRPIVADQLYGGGRELIKKTEVLDRGFCAKVHNRVDRHLLHAWHISFSHPTTGEQISCFAPLPEDISAALKLITRRQEDGSGQEIESAVREQFIRVQNRLQANND